MEVLYVCTTLTKFTELTGFYY